MKDIRKEQLRIEKTRPAARERYTPDLSNILGVNPADAMREKDPFGGEIPNDAKGYAQFQKYHEDNMMDILHQQGTLKLTAGCQTMNEKGVLMLHKKPLEHHFGSNVTLACDHVLMQDPHNPEGVYFLPLRRGFSDGYYLCKTCWGLMQKRKFNPALSVKGKCSACVGECLERIDRIHPDRLVNLASLS